MFLFISLVFMYSGVFAQQQQQMILPAPSQPTESVKPTLIKRNEECQIKYIDGKEIKYNNNNPADCLAKAQHEQKMKHEYAAAQAERAYQMTMQTPSPQKAKKCIRVVGDKSSSCLLQTIIDSAKSIPKYVVTRKNNKAYVYADGEPIMLAVMVQRHFKKVPKPKNKMEEIINNSKDVMAINALGQILASKQTKQPKQSKCICPSPSKPHTVETLVSPCAKVECPNNDFFIGLLANAEIKTEDEEQDDKGKNGNKKEEKAK